jgi:predicted phage baseplate assembly protein
MPLPIPNLDNRRFQEILDEARRLIPKFCPEWTDHNLSDPGITLLELFAWMTETLLYRVNQVPEKNYIKFLDMIGLKLSPPRSARAPITFYLSATQPNEITISEGTEVATVRTETAPAIIFTTESDFVIRPPTIVGAFTHRETLGEIGWASHDLSRLELPDQSVLLFPNPPAANDAFYLAFDKDHSQHVIALTVGCKSAGGAGVNPLNPPFVWEAWQDPIARWVRCEIEQEGTGAFNTDGEIVMHVPLMHEEEFNHLRAYWIRCRLTEAQSSDSHYEISPEIERYFRVESRGATSSGRHAVSVKNEVIGNSDGSPGQSFNLLNFPILARDPEMDYLIVEPPNGPPERWKEVPDFADSKSDDRCFGLDSLDGTVTFGPSLLQPDGSVVNFGAIPPKGSILRFSRYRHGGGVVGNVPRAAISVLKSAIPYVAEVVNREPALGGLDAQSLEDLRLKAAQQLRSCTRAVTAEDFEFHACQVAGVARARCLGPGPHPGDPSAIRPGQVFMLVLPQVESSLRPQPEHLRLSEELRGAITEHLLARCVLGIGVEVRMPEIICISVRGELLVPENSPPQLVLETQRRAEAELYHFLNPYVGGPQRTGWPFGRDLHLSEIYGLLQRIPSVDYVEGVRIEISELGQPESARPAPPRVTVGAHALICSGQHSITVNASRKFAQTG